MADFKIRVIVDPSGATTGTKQVEAGLEKLNASADRTRRLLSNAFKFAGITFGIKQLVDLLDTFTSIQNRLRVVTQDEEALVRVTNALAAIANQTRSSFQGTAELYSRVALSARDLGKSERELLQFTESLNKAIILSGASSQEANAGLIQLSQGLASGTLRGDELRSVLEQLPAVADVIAKRLGVTRGQLRELGKDGKITSDVIIAAFADAREELDTKFAKTVPTIGQAFTILNNQLVKSAENFKGTSGFIAEFVILVGNAVRGVSELVRAFEELGGSGNGAAGKLHDLNEELTQFFDEIDERAQPTLTKFGQAGKEIQDVEKRLAAARKGLAENKSGETGVLVFTRRIQELEARLKDLRGEQDKVAESSKKAAEARKELTIGPILANLEQEGRLLQLGNREREVEAKLIKIVNEAKKENIPITAGDEAQIRALVERNQLYSDQSKILQQLHGPQEEYNRTLEVALGLLQLGKISFEEYQQVVEQAAQSLDDATKKQKGVGEAANFEGILKDLREEATLLALGNEERRIQEQLLGLINKARTEGVPLTEEQQKQLELQLRTNAVLADQADVTAQALEPLKQYHDALALINKQYELGIISADQYKAKILELEIQALESSTNMGDGFERGLKKIQLEMMDTASLAENVLVNAFHSAEDALVEFAETGQIDFRKFAQSLIRDILKLVVRLLLLKALQAATGTGGGGPIEIEAGSSFVEGAFAHGGRPPVGEPVLVGEEGPEIFRPDSAGRIIPADRTASLVGQAAPVVNVNPTPAQVTVVNQFDSGDVVQAGLQAPQGEQQVLNIIRKNRNNLKRELA